MSANSSMVIPFKKGGVVNSTNVIAKYLELIPFNNQTRFAFLSLCSNGKPDNRFIGFNLEAKEQASSEKLKEGFDKTAFLYKKILDGLKEQINKQTKD